MNRANVPALMDQTADGERLRQMLRWALAVDGVMVLTTAVAGAAFASSTLLLISGVMLLMAGGIGGAQILARRGSRQGAVLLVAGMGLVLTLINTVLLPALMPGMVMVPLVLIVLLLPYVPPQATRILAPASLGCTLLIYLLGTFLPPVVTQPSPETMVFVTATLIVSVSAIALLVLWQFNGRLIATLHAAQAANAALTATQDGLEREVAARTADLHSALADVEARAAEQAALIAENNQQREVIREMSVPILPVSATTLVMPLIGALDSARLRDVQEQALARVEHTRARRLILDITGVPVVDTQVAKGLVETVQSLRLLGAEGVLVGVRPEVAQTIIGLGLTLASIQTAADVQSAVTSGPPVASARLP